MPHRGGLGPGDVIDRGIARLGTRPVWLGVVTAYGIFAWVFLGSSAPFAVPAVAAACGQVPLDVRFTSSAADVTAFLATCGTEGLAAYRAMETVDLVYPLVSALALAATLAFTLRGAGHRLRRWLPLVPFIVAALDYLENACAWLALAAFPTTSPTDSLLGVATAAKTVAFTGTVTLVVTVVAWRAGGWLRRRWVGHTRDVTGGASVGVATSDASAEVATAGAVREAP